MWSQKLSLLFCGSDWHWGKCIPHSVHFERKQTISLKILTNKKILVISPEPWQHNLISKHHYAITLAKKDNVVFFLNPPSDKNLCSHTDYANVFTIDYKPLVRGLNGLPGPLARFLAAFDIKRLFSLAKTEFDVIWSFDPYRFQFLDQFKASVKIYFAADWHASRKNEGRLANHAHLVLSPSRLLLDEIKTRTPRIFLNHAVEDYFFTEEVVTTVPGKQKFKVGYVGNLQSKFLDFDLLKNVVAFNPDCDFIFAGDDSGPFLETIKACKNVYFIGSLDNRIVPSFLKACEVLLLCYDTDKYRVEASNSHKIMEYLASGKSIVSTRMQEYKNFPELIFMPEENSKLPELLKTVVNNLPECNSHAAREKRIKYANQHTYDRQLIQIDRYLQEIRANFEG